MDESKLSAQQLALLQYLQQRDQAGQPPPTIREIQTGLSLSSASVAAYHLKALVRAGYVTRLRANGRFATRGIILNKARPNGKPPADVNGLLQARIEALEAELKESARTIALLQKEGVRVPGPVDSEPVIQALQVHVERLEAENRTLLTTVRVNKVQIAALQRENRALTRALATPRKESEP